MMTDLCEQLSDRMPAVAAGTDSWTAAESAHLAACAACAAEWRLIEQARGLGAGAAARIDPDRLTTAVLAGVARRRRAARWRRGAWLTGLAAAAAVTMVVWTGRPKPDDSALATGRDSAPVVATVDEGFHLPLAELENLDAEQLQRVLDGLDVPVGEAAPGGVPSFGELDDQQLERVLRSLEG